MGEMDNLQRLTRDSKGRHRPVLLRAFRGLRHFVTQWVQSVKELEEIGAAIDPRFIVARTT